MRFDINGRIGVHASEMSRQAQQTPRATRLISLESAASACLFASMCWHRKVICTGARAHTRASDQGHDAASVVKILLPGIGASFERRICSIEVKWASVEEK